MSNLKNGDFTIKHLLTDCPYSLADLRYLNSTDPNNYKKCPLFMAEIKIKQPALPDGVKFAVTRLEDRPAGKPAPILYQEILLSYLGNAAKTELEKNDWRPKAMTKLEKMDPEKALANLYPDYKTYIFRMASGGKDEELTVDAWIKACIAAYGFGLSSNTGAPFDAIALKILKQMHLHKVTMPNITADQLKYFRTLVTIDDETGLVSSLTPAPAAPVSADAPVEKKSPSENENPPKPEEIGTAVAADPHPLNFADILEEPAPQGYRATFQIHDEVVYTNTAATTPITNVQIHQ